MLYFFIKKKKKPVKYENNKHYNKEYKITYNRCAAHNI